MQPLADAVGGPDGTGPDTTDETPYYLRYYCADLIEEGEWEDLEGTLTDLEFLEDKVRTEGANALATDFVSAIRALPGDRRRRRVLELLVEALRRDLKFIERHPTTLFQCLWNSCWWYDTAESGKHYLPPEGGWGDDRPPWEGGSSEQSLGQTSGVTETAGPPTTQPALPSTVTGTFRSWTWVKDDYALHRATCPHCGHWAELRVYFRDGPPESIARRISGLRIKCGDAPGCTVGTGDGSGLYLLPQKDPAWTRERVCAYLTLIGSPLATHPCLARIPSESGLAELGRLVKTLPHRSSPGECTEGGSGSTGESSAGLTGATSPSETTRPLSRLLESWRDEQLARGGARTWLRALRPPRVPIGTGQKAVFQGHEGAVNSVGISPHGRFLASGSADETVRLWDVDSGAELRCMRMKGEVNAIAFSPDGELLVAGDQLYIKAWTVEDGKERVSLPAESGIRSLVFSPDGRLIAGATSRGNVSVWSLEGRSRVASTNVEKKEMQSVAFTRGGALLVSDKDGAVLAWDPNAGEGTELVVHEPDVHVMCTALSAGGDLMVAGAKNSWTVWSVEGRRLLFTFRRDIGFFRAVAFSPDARRIVTASTDRTVRVWETATGKQLACHRGHGPQLNSVTFSRDSRWVASVSDDKTIRLWEAEQTVGVPCLRGHKEDEWIHVAAFTPDGKWLITGGDWSVRVWDADTGVERASHRFSQGTGIGSKVLSVAVSPDSKRFSIVRNDGKFDTWELGRFLIDNRSHREGEDRSPMPRTTATAKWDYAGGAVKTVLTEAEIAIESADTRGAVAWFPAVPWSIASHPSGLIHAGVDGQNLYVFKLEGAFR